MTLLPQDALYPGRFAAMAAVIAALATASVPATATSAAGAPPPLQALPALAVTPYLGTWYQVAWFPNRFQRQCVTDTTATYARQPDGTIQVTNRCRGADGREDSVTGVARPAGSRLDGDTLAPAQLEVSFLPRWLRWLPAWGRYWVIQLADDGRYAVVSEHSRQYLWVLARAPQLSAADESAIRSRLIEQGFDLSAWQAHTHTAGPARP
jgi:apolipoprotein D and lipocalin family protein